MERKHIFVFGSNLAGRHGAGSAKEALLNHGAVYGVGEGPQGNSWAIPTKDEDFNVLSLKTIEAFVNYFIMFAEENLQYQFDVVPIGCGLAGYTPEQIAPMFKDSPPNVNLPQSFKKVLNV